MNSAPLARVLIVDDEAAQMRALRDTLRDQGYETAGFTTGEGALRALREEQFDLLLTDLMMPGMDGVALLAAAVKIDPQLVGILMTGKGTIETAVQAMQAGALDYILKPFKVSAILPVVARAVSVRRLRLENLDLRNTVAIHELNQAIAHTLDPNVLLDKIADAALAQFEADEASIMLLADDGRFLYVAAIRGERRDALLGERVPIGEGIAGWVAARREPLVLEGEIKDPRLAPRHPRAEIQSALSMPLITRNKLIGVINVNCTRKRRTFAAGQIKVLGIFTNAAAAGIEAARLYEDQRRADARYREVLHMAADGIVSIDDEQRIVVFNGGAENLFGYRAEEVLGRPLNTLLPAEAAEAHRLHVRSFGQGPDRSRQMGARDQRLFGRRKDGTLFHAEVGISKRSEHDKKLYTAVVRDITQRVQQEERIARLTRIHTVLSGINSTIVRVRDRQELFNEACRIAVEHGNFGMAWIGLYDPAAQEVTPVAWAGFEASEYLGGVKSPIRDDLPQGRGILAQAIKSRKPVFDNDITADPEVGGKRRAEAIGRGYRSVIVLPLIVEGEVVGSLSLFAKESKFFDDEEIKLLTELAGDVSFALDHIAKEQKLDYLAYYDSLTGLPNRTLFNDRLEQRVSAARKDRKGFAVVMLDLERFRNINETLGRQAGDDLLRQVGQRVKNTLEETDILANVGGDHFAIATRRGEEGGDAAHILERVLSAAFGQPFQIGGNDLRVGARTGVSIYPADGADADSLLRNAEAALRKAKASGERYLFYQPKMNAAVAENLLLENRLRQALEKEQFVLHYQPKVDLAKGVVSGLEALIRWNDPETGLVPPIRFIPLLEETGMILDVGRWAVRKALEDYRKWHARGLQPPRIAVNVSPIQIRQKDFVSVVRDAISEFPAGSHGLDLEITEGLIMDDIEGNIEKLRALRDGGVDIAIDDFGTGYSSLGYLARLPVNALKVDRSFIITMVKSADSMAIVSAIISLAHSLKLKVIAEGVETEDQRNWLKRLECDEMQGYLFSRPLPAAEVEAKFLGSAAAR
jgi:diguanylate cyclase (GGDEF)-like protein/PAS domain S-box-containing protein